MADDCRFFSTADSGPFFSLNGRFLLLGGGRPSLLHSGPFFSSNGKFLPRYGRPFLLRGGRWLFLLHGGRRPFLLLERQLSSPWQMIAVSSPWRTTV
jgi:hypothetical protein